MFLQCVSLLFSTGRCGWQRYRILPPGNHHWSHSLEKLTCVLLCLSRVADPAEFYQIPIFQINPDTTFQINQDQYPTLKKTNPDPTLRKTRNRIRASKNNLGPYSDPSLFCKIKIHLLLFSFNSKVNLIYILILYYNLGPDPISHLWFYPKST